MASLFFIPDAREPFVTQLTWLAFQTGTIYSALVGAQRQWMTPHPGPGPFWDMDPFSVGPDEGGLWSAFNRNETDADIGLNNRYVAAHRDPSGLQAEAQSGKFQIDELAVMERSYRLQIASSPRMHAHAAATRRGHAHARGAINRKIEATTYFTRAAAAEPDSPVVNNPFAAVPDLEATLPINPDLVV